MALQPDNPDDPRSRRITDVLDWWTRARTPAPDPALLPAPYVPAPPPVLPPAPPVPAPFPGPAPVATIGSQEGVPGPEIAGPTGLGVPQDPGTVGPGITGAALGYVPPPPAPGVPAVPVQRTPEDYYGARAVEDAAQNEAGVANATASQARAGVAGAIQDREAAAAQQHLDRMTALDAEFRTARDGARAEAERETSVWMRKMEEHATAEPNPNRYWENQDGFGKALWILGQAFGSAAQIGMPGAGTEDTPALRLLRHEIARDVSYQKDRIAREGDVLKARGDVMLRHQVRLDNDLRDDRSQALLRLDALGRVLQLRAQRMTPEEIARTGTADALAWIQAQKLSAATRRTTEAFHARESQLQRNLTASEGAANRQNARDLAAIHAQATLDAANAKKEGAGDKDMRPLSSRSGFSVQNGGKFAGEVAGPKDTQKELHEVAAGALQTAVAMKKLYKAYEGSDVWDRTFHNKAELEGALEQAAGQIVHEINKGSTTEEDINRAKKVAIGMASGLWAQGKGPGKEEVLRYLESQIRDLPRQAASKAVAIPGLTVHDPATGKYRPFNAQAGDDISFVFDERNVTEPTAAPTATQARAAGGEKIDRPYVVAPEEYRARAKLEASTGQPGSNLPPLPKEIDVNSTEPGDEGPLRGFRNVAKTGTPEVIQDHLARAVKVIDVWQKEHPDRAREAIDARARLTARAQDALTEANAKVNAAFYHVGGLSNEAVAEAAKDQGLAVNASDVLRLAELFRARRIVARFTQGSTAAQQSAAANLTLDRLDAWKANNPHYAQMMAEED